MQIRYDGWKAEVAAIGQLRNGAIHHYMSEEKYRSRAVESLESLGLREYEAKCFVALAQLSEGTAKEVSKVASVPRSRVYDSLEKLQDRGLVDIRESNPRKYRGVPVETAVGTLESEFDSHLETVSDCLEELQVAGQQDDDGFWTVAGRENVTDRGRDLIQRADREVLVVLPDDERIVERSLSWIRTALDRGVTAFVDVPTSQLKAEVETTAPGARVTVSDREFGQGDDPGRTLLVDDASVLLSTVKRSLPTVQEETAIVSRGGVGSRIGSMVREVSRSRHRGFTASTTTGTDRDTTAND